MTQGVIELLATLAVFADEKTLTEWMGKLLPKDVIGNMTYTEKFEYLQELKFDGKLQRQKGGVINGYTEND